MSHRPAPGTFHVRRRAVAPSDFGPDFSHLEVRILLEEAVTGTDAVYMGSTVYPADGRTHVPHLHHHSEEVLVVLRGAGVHRVGDDLVELEQGDAILLPRGVPHAAWATGGAAMEALWFFPSMSTLEATGYEEVSWETGPLT